MKPICVSVVVSEEALPLERDLGAIFAVYGLLWDFRLSAKAEARDDDVREGKLWKPSRKKKENISILGPMARDRTNAGDAALSRRWMAATTESRRIRTRPATRD